MRVVICEVQIPPALSPTFVAKCSLLSRFCRTKKSAEQRDVSLESSVLMNFEFLWVVLFSLSFMLTACFIQDSLKM